MLTIKSIPVLMRIAAKLDIRPLIERAKTVDIFTDPDGAEAAMKELSKEKLGLLAAELLAELMPQLGKIADDIPPLVAAYKGVSLEEANSLDAAAVINEIINDEAVRGFFSRALRKNAAHGA